MGPKKKMKGRNSQSGAETLKSCIIHIKGFECKYFVSLNAERFSKIQHVADIRQRQPIESQEKLDEVCKNIPDHFESHHVRIKKQLQETSPKEVKMQGEIETSVFCVRRHSLDMSRKTAFGKRSPSDI